MKRKPKFLLSQEIIEPRSDLAQLDSTVTLSKVQPNSTVTLSKVQPNSTVTLSKVQPKSTVNI